MLMLVLEGGQKASLFLDMPGALTILRKIEKVDILKSAKVAMRKTEEEITEQQAEQLSRGQDRYGSSITNYETGSDTYSPSYAVYKGFSRPINLRDTGEYYQGLKLDVRGMIFKIYSGDWKNEMLEKTYHPLGLGIEAKNKYIISLRPVFINEIKSEYLL